MPRPYARGCVLTRAGSYGIVWADRGSSIELVPVIVPRDNRRGDIALELPDLIAGGVSLPGAIVRADLLNVAAAGQTVSGTISTPIIVRMERAILQTAQDALTVRRWSGDRAHRHRASGRCVRMVP